MTENSNEIKISHLLYKERKLLIFTVLLSIILGVVITFITPKKYAAHAIVYPPSSNTLSDVVNTPDFGFEIHADRLIQIFDSQTIKDSVVKKFDLMTYFELDTNEMGWRNKLNEKYAHTIKFSRTRYLSVVVSVTTEDPFMSANVANYILSLVNDVRSSILKENGYKAVEVYKAKMLAQQERVDSLLQQLYTAAESENGANPLGNKHLTSINERNRTGNYTPADGAIKSIATSEFDTKTEILISEYLFENDKLYSLKKEYSQAKEKLTTPIPDIYVVSEAAVDDHKVSPKLSINLMIAFGIGLLGAITIIFLKHKWNDIKQSV